MRNKIRRLKVMILGGQLNCNGRPLMDSGIITSLDVEIPISPQSIKLCYIIRIIH